MALSPDLQETVASGRVPQILESNANLAKSPHPNRKNGKQSCISAALRYLLVVLWMIKWIDLTTARSDFGIYPERRPVPPHRPA